MSKWSDWQRGGEGKFGSKWTILEQTRVKAEGGNLRSGSSLLAALANPSKGPQRPEAPEAWLPEFVDFESKTISSYPEPARL